MQYFPAPLNTQQSNQLAEKISTRLDDQGWGFWALELKQSAQFIGFAGLNNPDYELPVYPCTEIGWRLARAHWGMGYATEAGKAALPFGFNKLKLSQIYAFATVTNSRSINVMSRLGMTNTHQNFKHPIIPSGHNLSEHVLFKLNNSSK